MSSARSYRLRVAWLSVLAVSILVVARVSAEELESKNMSTYLYAQFTKPNLCQLKARGQMYPKARSFKFSKLCRYDEPTESWQRNEAKRTYSDRIDSVSRQVYSGNTDQVLMDISDKVGLFWLEWEENGVTVSVRAYCGPIMCDDVMIGPMRQGEMIATCVPRESSAIAKYVRDPSLFCR